jgi:hypothetical protein
MSKSAFALMIAASLMAGSAAAQPAAAPQAGPAAETPAKTPPAKTKTVEGLTVVAPPPLKPCAVRDKDCVAQVVAELKQLYPEQLKKFCFQRQMRAMRTAMVADQLGLDGPPPSTAVGVNSALATACAPDRK